MATVLDTQLPVQWLVLEMLDKFSAKILKDVHLSSLLQPLLFLSEQHQKILTYKASPLLSTANNWPEQQSPIQSSHEDNKTNTAMASESTLLSFYI